MDKFGRRIFRMEDDTTVRHTKGGDSENPNATTATIKNKSSSSSDLKSLLPTAKMRFMKLDYFGRRVQRMEDDGTVKHTKSRFMDYDYDSSDAAAAGEEFRGVKGGDKIIFTSGSDVQQPSTDFDKYNFQGIVYGQSLTKLIIDDDSSSPSSDLEKDAATSTGVYGADLKALLPKQKMRFMKLDKFGRRVQRMEDDGTVKHARGVVGENHNAAGGSSDSFGGGGDNGGEDYSDSIVDLGTSGGSAVAESCTSVNLKDLALISKRPTFTKLDFKGGSVEDERRMKTATAVSPTSSSSSSSSLSGLSELALSSKRPTFTKLDFKGGSVVDERRMKKKKKKKDSSSDTLMTNSKLKDLLPKRPLFTKLDFHGGNVEDERRMKKSSSSASLATDSSTNSNLKDLLPKRPLFTKLDFHGGNVEDNRRMKKSSSSASAASNEGGGSGGGGGGYASNLKTLLPERKFMWKKEERRRSTTNDFIGSVGGDFIAKTTTSTTLAREMKQKAMREEVIASSAVTTTTSSTLENDDGDNNNNNGDGGSSRDEGGSYSNLTGLLPQKKFVFRGEKK
jgi:hypothetical protein